MTNGSVAALSAPFEVPAVNSAVTNGDVAAAAPKSGIRQLTVTYTGGEQTILVPPTAPIVTFKPGSASDVAAGNNIFILATKDGTRITAHLVALGAGGVRPPW
jgi:hypothetical protein